LWADYDKKVTCAIGTRRSRRLAIGASQNGSLAADLLDLTNPRHDFVALAQPLAE
jgi:hypothetical protein